MKSKGYCFILQLNCMGIVAKELIAEQRTEEAKRRGLLSDSQYGSGNRRSAVNAAPITVD